MSRIFTSLPLIGALWITGCASVTETIPTVKIVREKPKTVATVMSQYTRATPTVQRAEAPMVCDNANMRERARDNDPRNDTARVLILEDNNSANTVLADVTVNCKDYFESRGQWANSQSVASPAPAVFGAPVNDQTQRAVQYQYSTQDTPPAPAPAHVIQANTVTNIATEQPMYRIRRGDNLYRIARSHCTNYEDLANLNNINDPSKISPGQMIKLPRGGC